jgi:hypothetical protein
MNAPPALLAPGLALAVAGLALSACSEVEDTSSGGYEPAHVETVAGTEVKRVTFTREGARRTGLRTATVRRSGSHRVVPHNALIYDPAGTSYVYTRPEPLTFLRVPVNVDRVEGDRVLLADGPSAGTAVVTVGATEVYGTELGIAGDH